MIFSSCCFSLQHHIEMRERFWLLQGSRPSSAGLRGNSKLPKAERAACPCPCVSERLWRETFATFTSAMPCAKWEKKGKLLVHLFIKPSLDSSQTSYPCRCLGISEMVSHLSPAPSQSLSPCFWPLSDKHPLLTCAGCSRASPSGLHW